MDNLGFFNSNNIYIKTKGIFIKQTKELKVCGKVFRFNKFA